MRFTLVAIALFSVALRHSKSIAHASSVATESSAAAAGAEESIDYTTVDLHALSNDELVAICTDRGFELVTDVDDATGEPLSYSHDDYVDAAHECLQLEAEMEEYLASNQSNPNMLKEMEDERDRMLLEQEELERQLKEARGQLNSSERVASNGESTAFIKNADTESKETEGIYNPDEKGDEESKDQPSPEDLMVDGEVIDLDVILNEVIDESQENKARLDASEAEEADARVHTVNDEEETPANASANSEVTSRSNTGHSGLVFEFKEVAREFCEKVKQDFDTLANIVLPKPIRGPMKKVLNKGYEIGKEITVQAVDMIKRYSKVLMEKGKTAYENRKQEQSQREEKNECNDEQENSSPAAATD